MITYTEEQQAIIDHIDNNEGILLVKAGAGCGKSFIAKQVVRELNLERVLYTAFNKAIVEEAKEKFEGMVVECKTLHALAYRFTNPGKLQEFTYKDLPGTCYDVKSAVMESLNAFFLSASTDIYEFLEACETEEEVQDTAVRVLEEMAERKRPWTFSFMLKYFHLLLKEEEVSPEYSLVILDEINDTTAVALEIFRLLKTPNKLGLGEPDQAIYEFMNLVDGFSYFNKETTLPLTHSFRCSKEIASSIEVFMQASINSEFRFEGTDNPVKNGKTLRCTRTNGAVIANIQERLTLGKGFTLLRKPAEIFSCALAVSSASAGKKVFQKQYRYLEDIHFSWKTERSNISFFTYLKQKIKDQEVHSAIALLLRLSQLKVNIFSLYKSVKEHKADPNYCIATVFTAKGLEYQTVYIDDDLNKATTKALGNIRGNDQWRKDAKSVAEIRMYYVACSRCGVDLLNAQHLR